MFGCFGAIACQAGGLPCPVVSGYMDSWEQGYKCHSMTLKVAECLITDLAALVLVLKTAGFSMIVPRSL